MSVALDKEPRPPRAALPARQKGLLGRSTALRHLVLVLAAFVGVVLLLEVLGPFRDSQLTSMAYYVPAVAGLTVLTGINGQIPSATARSWRSAPTPRPCCSSARRGCRSCSSC